MSDMGVYKITNTINGKVYIGQSIRLSRRLDTHYRDLKNNRHPNQHLQNAYNKYGNVFRIEILEYCSNKLQLDELERYYISYYDSMNSNKGYNKEDGGHLNKHLSKETKEKISKAVKGENNPMFGKHHSKDTKNKISNANKGEKHHHYWEGKTRPEKTRIKISKTRNTTGFYCVRQEKRKDCKQGFIWRYIYRIDKKLKEISSINLLKLKNKVEAQGLPWEIIDEAKAKQSLELNDKYHKGEHK